MKNLLPCLLMATMLLASAGCGDAPQTPTQRPAVAGAELLRAGSGYSADPDPVVAAREALAQAVAGFGNSPCDLLLVWDNWPTQEAAGKGLAELARRVDKSVIYGGHVAWPVSASRSDQPAVAVAAFAGGWAMRPGIARRVGGAEKRAAAELLAAIGRDDPAGGQVLLLFGELPGPRAERLLAELGRQVGRNVPVFGGGGGGHGGSGWQYVAGQMTSDCVWAIRLSGPIRASSGHVAISSDATTATMTDAAMLGLAILQDELGQPGTGFRLLLLTHSAGWLGMLDSRQFTTAAIERLGPGGALAGWAGLSQIAPAGRDHHPQAGQFDLAMLLLAPEASPPATQPE